MDVDMMGMSRKKRSQAGGTRQPDAQSRVLGPPFWEYTHVTFHHVHFWPTSGEDACVIILALHHPCGGEPTELLQESAVFRLMHPIRNSLCWLFYPIW